MTTQDYVGRLAPSPTGAQHVGNARTFLVAWLATRSCNGQLILRIEDLDTPRTKAWANQQAVQDLRWLGLDWDTESQDVVYQSQRADRYRQVLTKLQSDERVYPCTCTRSDIDAESSAPHESQLDGTVYSGKCQSRIVADHRELDSHGQRYAWRFRMPSGTMRWTDSLYGEQSIDAQSTLGDFVVARNYGPTAYQLAVVVDDHDFSVTEVVRGDDLVYSTYRQIAIYDALHWHAPTWFHVPLVVGSDGRRLAKRHGDTRLSTLCEQGVAPERLIGILAHSLNLIGRYEPLSASELLAHLSNDETWRQRMPTAPWVFDRSMI